MSDYIDRAALGIGLCNRDVFENKGYADGWNAAVKILKEAPAVDVQEIKHGKWEKFYSENEFENLYHCSICGHGVDVVDCTITPLDGRMNYCPECGAKMDGGNNNA